MRWKLPVFTVLYFIIVLGIRGVDAKTPQLTKEKAFNLAVQYLGLVDAKGVAYEQELLQIKGDTTPFLAPLLNGRTAWLIRFHGLRLTGYTDTEKDGQIKHIPTANPFIHNLNVLLDAHTGQLFRIWSGERIQSAPSKRRSNASTQQLWAYDWKRWEGLPKSMPKVGFLQAFTTTHLSHLAEQVDAVYVLASYNSSDGKWRHRPTWMVVDRTHERIMPIPKNVPIPLPNSSDRTLNPTAANPPYRTLEPKERNAVYAFTEVIDAVTGISHLGTFEAPIP
jgi:hypothetical protein